MQDNTDTSKLSLIELGGRIFQAIDFDKRTVMIDHYLSKIVRATGVDKVMPMDNENNAAYLIRMQAALVDSGKIPELLGGYLLPQGTVESEWTPVLAAQTAKFIKTLNTQQDRETVLTLGADIVFGFFEQGLVWLNRSLNALRKATPPSPTKSLAH